MRSNVHLTSNLFFLSCYQIVILEVFGNLSNTLLHRRLIGSNMDLRVLRCLIRRRDSSEIWNLSRTRLLVQPLWISLLCYLNRDIDKHLDERQWLICTLRLGM